MGRQITPIPFFSRTHPGKNMGFAEYLSRNTSSEAPTPSERDKNFVINTIEEIKHALLRNNLAPIGASETTSQLSQQNDVIKANHSRLVKNSAFCHLPRDKQLLVSLHNSISQIKQIIPHKNLVAITNKGQPYERNL